MSPDITPTPDEQRRLLSEVSGNTGLALRLAAALADQDAGGANAALDEIAGSPRAMFVTSGLALMACRLAEEMAERAGGHTLGWLHAVAMDVAAEVDQFEGDDDEW